MWPTVASSLRAGRHTGVGTDTRSSRPARATLFSVFQLVFSRQQRRYLAELALVAHVGVIVNQLFEFMIDLRDFGNGQCNHLQAALREQLERARAPGADEDHVVHPQRVAGMTLIRRRHQHAVST